MAKIASIIESLKTFLNSPQTLKEYRLDDTYFTRISKLGFINTVLLGLCQLKGSLEAELYNILTINNLEEVSKSAYSQSRYKIKSDIYVKLNQILLAALYSKESLTVAPSQFGGYAVHAVDGTKITLPNTAGLRAHFGSQKGGSKEVPSQTAMCLLMCCHDVLNDYILKSTIENLAIGEQTVAKKWTQQYDSQAITIFDRGFASIFFVILCSSMLNLLLSERKLVLIT